MDILWQYLFSCGAKRGLVLDDEDDDGDDDLTIATEGTSSLVSKTSSQKSKQMMKNNDSFIPLCLSHKTLNLVAGQILQVEVQDWFLHVLQQHNQKTRSAVINRSLATNSAWMIQLTEELKWTAQGRTTSSCQTWDLLSNHHEIPMELRRSTETILTRQTTNDDQEADEQRRLIRVSHFLQIYLKMTSSNSTKNRFHISGDCYGGGTTTEYKDEVVAMSESIPVRIVSHRQGWDA